MLSPLCQDFLQKLDSKINNFKNRIEAFIVTHKESKDLYNLLEKEFGKEVYDFKENYQNVNLMIVNKETTEQLGFDLQCSKLVKKMYDDFLLFIDTTNSNILFKDNNS